MNDPITVKFRTDFALAIVGSGRPGLDCDGPAASPTALGKSFGSYGHHKSTWPPGSTLKLIPGDWFYVGHLLFSGK
jgi:hypothetical protein